MHDYVVCQADLFGGPTYVLCDFSKDEFLMGAFISGIYMTAEQLGIHGFRKQQLNHYRGEHKLNAKNDIEAIEEYRDIFELITSTDTFRGSLDY